MQCFCEGGLHYDAPSEGDYGICRMGLMIPESIELFVGPSACGRHGALGAIKNGYKDRIFYLYLDQSDIVKGYDHLVGDAVEKVLKTLKKKPKVVVMIFTCIDDLVGTDHAALKEELTERFPGVVFQSSHMNPIKTNTAEPPAAAIQRDLYRTIATDYENRDVDVKTLTKDDGVNILGVYEHIPESCELSRIARLRHIDRYTSFEDFKEMSLSKLNLVMGPLGLLAAKDMKRRFGIPYLEMPVTYNLSEIKDNYRRLRDVLGVTIGTGFDDDIKKAEDAIERAKNEIGDLPVIVDSSATYHPFSLAKALLQYGFNVVRIETDSVLADDKANMEWIREKFPETELYRPDSVSAVLFDRKLEESLAVGIQASYMAGSRYTADIFADVQMFGYDGVAKLMELMISAVQKPRDLKQLIEEYGLVI